jgi:gluconolactonase
VAADGTLKGKTLFAAEGSDGMTMDAAGNVYMTTDAVLVYAPSGELLERIEVPQAPTNLCFTGEDRKTLFITARTSVYAVETSIGLEAAARSVRADRPGRTDRDE